MRTNNRALSPRLGELLPWVCVLFLFLAAIFLAIQTNRFARDVAQVRAAELDRKEVADEIRLDLIQLEVKVEQLDESLTKLDEWFELTYMQHLADRRAQAEGK